jgi:hypothetical protein
MTFLQGLANTSQMMFMGTYKQHTLLYETEKYEHVWNVLRIAMSHSAQHWEDSTLFALQYKVSNIIFLFPCSED